jgi:uncharacterized repeat protein (TIGR03806 family)
MALRPATVHENAPCIAPVGQPVRALSPLPSKQRRLALLVIAVLLASACQARRRVHPYLDEPYPRMLAEWRLFVGEPRELHPNQGVVPYDVNTPLFSDYADKHRFVWMPPGTSAVYRAGEVFDFPVGTIFSKTFAFPFPSHPGPERLIETRLLVRTHSGWVGLPYVWNQAQTEATLDLDADPTVVHFTDPAGRERTTGYIIPNANQCKECHARSKIMGPLGPKARNLNKLYPYASGPANQLSYWTQAGYLKGAPDPSRVPRAAVWNDPSTGSLEARARAYLDVNCGTCHRAGGAAATSALYLDFPENDPEHLGVCKNPVAAGRGAGDLLFDVVPGAPDQSILVFRMESTAPKVMMPEIGRTLAHDEGVELVREWVASLGGVCQAPVRLEEQRSAQPQMNADQRRSETRTSRRSASRPTAGSVAIGL